MTREEVIAKISNYLYLSGATSGKKASDARATKIVDMLIEAGVIVLAGVGPLTY